MFAETKTNYGWMIRDDVENASSQNHGTCQSKDNNWLAQAPQLDVTYTS